MLILKVEEQTPPGKIGLKFYFPIESGHLGKEWLVTNGFQHHPLSHPALDYWTRDAVSSVKFMNGIHGTGCLMMVKANFPLKAEIVPGFELSEIMCESL